MQSSVHDLTLGVCQRAHLCKHNPCQADWEVSKYGPLGPPIHVQPQDDDFALLLSAKVAADAAMASALAPPTTEASAVSVPLAVAVSVPPAVAVSEPELPAVAATAVELVVDVPDLELGPADMDLDPDVAPAGAAAQPEEPPTVAAPLAPPNVHALRVGSVARPLQLPQMPMGGVMDSCGRTCPWPPLMMGLMLEVTGRYCNLRETLGGRGATSGMPSLSCWAYANVFA